jgi:hypothetical protein
MNDIFDIKRFGLLFKKLIFERSLHIFGSFGLMMFFVWFMYHTNGSLSEGWWNAQIQSFAMGLLLGGVYWTSVVFNHFSEKAEGYSFLTLPASHFEKWLCGVGLLCVFILSYCIFYRVLDASYVSYFRTNLNPTLKDYDKLLASYKVMSFITDSIYNVKFAFVALLNFTGVIAIGAMYFNKMALIKSLFLGFLLVICLDYLNDLFAVMLFQADVNPSFFWGSIWINKTNEQIELPENITPIYSIFFSFILPILLWSIALVRLKEKEI